MLPLCHDDDDDDLFDRRNVSEDVDDRHRVSIDNEADDTDYTFEGI